LTRPVVFITGGSDGIGFQAARMLVALGCTLAIHGRDQQKLLNCQRVLSDKVHVYCADLSDLEAVRSLAVKVANDFNKIDVLINNAGVLKASATHTMSGRDLRFEVNTIAPYLLTRRLLPLIPKDGRVINLSSAAQSAVDCDAFTKFRPMTDMDAYSQSKAAITMWSQELAARHPDGPAFVSVNPGSLLGTKMVKEGFGIEGKDVTIGAEILLRLATDPNIQDHSGDYFCNDQGAYTAPDPCVLNDQARQRIMSVLDQMTLDTPLV